MKTKKNGFLVSVLALASASACTPSNNTTDTPDNTAMHPESTKDKPTVVHSFDHDAGRRLRDPLAKDRLVINIKSIPKHLVGLSVTDAAWQEWVQERLGDAVQVVSLRTTRRAQDGTKTLVVSVNAESTDNIIEAVARAGKDNHVNWAEPEPIWKGTASVSDPDVGQQWYLNRIGAPSAWDTTFGSSNVIVAVIDSGIEFAHNDLRDAIWQNPGENPGNNIDDDKNGFVDDVHGWDFVSAPASAVVSGEDPEPRDNDPSDFHGHGTAMSGVIGARANGIGMVGVAPGVTIMPLRAGFAVPTGHAGFYPSDTADAIIYAVDNGAHVINMSLSGYTPARVAQDAVDYAASKGVIIVASAGNDGVENLAFPAAYQNVIGVVATDENDKPAVAKWATNYGRWVSIAAPGLDIYTTVIGNTFSSVSGTSPAAAVVSGIAALARSANPNLPFSEMRAHLLSSVDGFLGHDDISRQPIYGSGFAYAAAAVEAPSASSKAYGLPIFIKERLGNGDQELKANEIGTINASWHVTTARSGLTGRLTTQDPYIRLLVDTVPLTVPQDAVATAEFGFGVNADVPADHTAELTLELIDDFGQVLETPISVDLAGTFRPAVILPTSNRQVMLPLPDGTDMLLMDGGWRNHAKAIYATIRHPSGAFSPLEILSRPNYDGKRPSAVMGPNGDIHVSFDQYVTSPGSAGRVAFVAYSRYNAATQTWSAYEFVAEGHSIALGDSGDYSAIGFDSNGQLHIAWPDEDGVQVVKQQNDGSWSAMEQVLTFNSPYETARIDMLTVDGDLELFVQYGESNLAQKPVLVLDYDGTEWSNPTETTPVTADDTVDRPFLSNGEVYHFFTVEEGAPTYLAKLNTSNMNWQYQRIVTDATGALFKEETSSILMGTDTAVSYTVFEDNPVDMEGELMFDTPGETVTLNVPGHKDWVSKHPTLHADQYGNIHMFTVEYYDATSSTTRATTYTSNATLNGDAVPGVPVVADDGAATADASVLSASWTSTYSQGDPTFEVALGTAPGTDDIVQWFDTEETSLTFDISPRKLRPEQVVYISVIAKAGMYESAMGFSNGIRYNPCDASPWMSNIVYRDAGMRVTHDGAVYVNSYWHASVTPGGQNGPWTLVKTCSGSPVIHACHAPEWDAGEHYETGDVVTYQGLEFEALWDAPSVAPTGENGSPWGWVRNCIPEQS